jgi:nucleotide-binding universal stress UspA family protein
MNLDISMHKEYPVSGTRRIIIGASGSPGSLQALRYAVGLAREDDALLVPVLAWLPPGGDFADRRYPSGYLRQVWKDDAWLRLWTALDRAWGGIAPAGRPAEPIVARGEAGEVLVAAASEPGDLLAVGAGRRAALRRVVPPKVSRYCLAHAACPVIAVPPPDLEAAAGHGLRGWAFRHHVLPHALDPDQVALRGTPG